MISEELLGAYLEGTLTGQEAAYVESQLDIDPDLQALADDVFAYADEPAPYELDLDDIDLPVADVEMVEEAYAEADVYDDAALCDWEPEEISAGDIDDGFEFIDDL